MKHEVINLSKFKHGVLAESSEVVVLPRGGCEGVQADTPARPNRGPPPSELSSLVSDRISERVGVLFNSQLETRGPTGVF